MARSGALDYFDYSDSSKGTSAKAAVMNPWLVVGGAALGSIVIFGDMAKDWFSDEGTDVSPAVTCSNPRYIVRNGTCRPKEETVVEETLEQVSTGTFTAEQMDSEVLLAVAAAASGEEGAGTGSSAAGAAAAILNETPVSEQDLQNIVSAAERAKEERSTAIAAAAENVAQQFIESNVPLSNGYVSVGRGYCEDDQNRVMTNWQKYTGEDVNACKRYCDNAAGCVGISFAQHHSNGSGLCHLHGAKDKPDDSWTAHAHGSAATEITSSATAYGHYQCERNIS